MRTRIRMSITLLSIIVFLSNLIPIIGPSLASGGIGFNEKRWKILYGMTRGDSIAPIIIGHIIFYFCFGLFLNFIIYWDYQKYFWLIIGLGFVCNLSFSIFFYFIGTIRYNKDIMK